MKSINRFLIDKGYSGNDEEISILKMVELVDEWQGDSQNITVKLIQFTKALSECMKENLRLESQLEKERGEEILRLKMNTVDHRDFPITCTRCGEKFENQLMAQGHRCNLKP